MEDGWEGRSKSVECEEGEEGVGEGEPLTVITKEGSYHCSVLNIGGKRMK